MTKDFYELFDKPAPSAPAASTVTQIDAARASRYAAKALEGEVTSVANAPEGTRNATLNTAAFSLGQLVAAGHIEEHVVHDALTGAARSAGLEEGEIAATLRSGLSSGMKLPRAVPELPENDAPAVTVLDPGLDPDLEAAPDLTSAEDDAFWAARPVLRHLHTFARARMVSPWAVLGVALARVVTATPNQVCLPPIVGGRASLNMFVGLVGPSGSGKGAAEAVAAEALVLPHIESHNVGSGEGIAHGYKRRVKGNLEWLDDDHAVLFSVPEIDSLAAQGDRKGATLMPQLRSGWTGEQLGFGYADPNKRIIVEAHQYRLCLVAGIQPGRAACLLDDADGGTPQRFLWMPATDPGAPALEPAAPTPLTWSPPPVGPVVTAGGTRVSVCEIAAETIKEARRARNRGDGDALDGHALLAQLKTAAAFGILDGRYGVSEEDWALAGVVAKKSAATRADVVKYLAVKKAEARHGQAVAAAKTALLVEETVADAAIKRVCGVLMKRLRKSGESLTLRELRRVAASRDSGYVETAVERLVEAGQIEVEDKDRALKYRATKEKP